MKRKTNRDKKPTLRAADSASTRSKAPAKRQHQWKLVGTLCFLAVLGISFICLRNSTRRTIPSSLPQTSPSGVNIRWRQIAKKPRMYITDNFLSSQEADLLIKHCTKNLAAATVGENRDAGSNLRNSSTDWCAQDEHEIHQVQDIIERVSVATRMDDEHGERLQIGYYHDEYQFYKLHYDSSPELPRYVTLFIYLNDVEEGGETIFPHALNGFNQEYHDTIWHLRGKDFRDYCKNEKDILRVKPRKGRAILFYNHDEHQNIEQEALHGGCPPLKGDKYFVTRWVRNYHHEEAGYFQQVKEHRKTHPENFDLKFHNYPKS